jgi:hypothetical protein
MFNKAVKRHPALPLCWFSFFEVPFLAKAGLTNAGGGILG